MKKLLACILGGLMLLGVTATPIHSEPIEIQRIEIQNSKFVHLFWTGFYDADYVGLLKATLGMKKGDCLKLTIMSHGGPAMPMLAIINHIESLKVKGVHVTTETAGLSASAGACLWLTGDKRIVHASDLIMFHTAVIRGVYGPVAREDLPKEVQWIMEQTDYFVRQYLLDILHDTELVNELLNAKGNKDGETNENWYNGMEVHKMGISTDIR